MQLQPKKFLFKSAVFCLVATLSSFCASEDATTTESYSCLTSSFASGTPTWISDNFSCVQVSVSGSNLVIKSNGMPPYSSGYYPSTSTNYTSMPSGRNANPNTISTSRTYTMTVPSSPTANCSSTSVTSSLGEQGILTNGVIVYNNAAAPGDTLSSEVVTFDGGDAHPDSSSIYHNHTQPTNITSNTGKIIGIAIDGLPILDKLELDGSTPTGLSSGDNQITHGHSHALSGGGKNYGTMSHYHILNDTTAGIDTILGSKLCATKGSLTKS